MAANRVVHEPDDRLGDGTTERHSLATEVDIAESALSQARGLMFRSSIPEDYALVLEVGSGGGLIPFSDGPARQLVHMMFVGMPLDIVWLVDDRVTKVASMRAWFDIGMGNADRIIELPAGAAEDVEPGDTVVVETAAETADGESTEPGGSDTLEASAGDSLEAAGGTPSQAGNRNTPAGVEADRAEPSNGGDPDHGSILEEDAEADDPAG